MVQVGNLVHTADRDCFVTLYLQKYTSLETETDDNDAAGEGTNSLRISMGSSPNAIYIRNANCGTKPILENIPLQNGSRYESVAQFQRYMLYGYLVTVAESDI